MMYPARFARSTQQGFTMLELVLVIALLGAMTLAATALFDTTLDQTRYDDTKVRLETLRRAMVGDPARTINGAPEIRGFVADMGRLPVNLQELLEAPANPAMLWGGDALGNVVSGVSGELWGGWRGPYLHTLPESGGNVAFRDGWGTAGDAPNYGWLYGTHAAAAGTACGAVSATQPTNEIVLQSCGLDGVVGGLDYAADYPASGVLVTEDDWSDDLQGQTIVVNFNKVPNQTVELKLRVYYTKDGAIQPPWDSLPLTMSGVTASGVLSTASFTFSGASPLPMGRHAAVVWCITDHASATQDVVYNGDCNAASNPTHDPYFFTMVPRAQLPTISWTIQ